MPINKPFLFDSDSLKNFHKRIFFSVLVFCFCFTTAFFKITYISISSHFDQPSKVTFNKNASSTSNGCLVDQALEYAKQQ